MDHKTSGPYKYYDRPSKGRAEGMKPTKHDHGWKFGMWLIAILLIVLIPVTYQLSANNLNKSEQATEVQKVSKPVKKKINTSSSTKKYKKKKQPKTINKSAETSTGSAKTEKVKSYVVQDGDTLSSIAAKNGMTVYNLEQLNGLSDSTSIRAGQTLKLN